MNDKVTQQIEALLDRAFEAEEAQEAYELARQVLELDGDNADALVLLSDATEDDEERLGALRRARELLAPGEGEVYDPEEDDGLFYVSVLHRLGSALLMDVPEEVPDVARELMAFDTEEGATLGRPLLYTALLRLGRFDELLALVEGEEGQSEEEEGCLSVEGAYGRALALFRKGDDKGAAEALLDALGTAPELPFYLLDFWVEPDEEEEDEAEICALAGLFAAAWLDDEKALGWLTTAAMAFGYLTDRLPEEVLAEMRPLLDEAGLMEVLEEEKGQIDALLTDSPDLPLEEIDFRALDFMAANPTFLGL
ncbi:hypothetical protein KAR29_08430 [Aminithiophilus ramosus]|uniref:Tetratricopeptide repeat protein n=2 Tax=Synergistales TaxID=649776 RepID=A0A9Q7EW47_9BACT|nr:hypothetical protein [Aminithiophilus ramosus]QTX31405.1 hypothetical protein KAR29_08430 [Aminithiophilus ramosus]QVL35205.1 hypothetical protein KIH16_08260 [Synergistota bacterium]